MALDRINGPWNESFQLLYTYKAKVEMASSRSVVETDKHTVSYKIREKSFEKEGFCLFQGLLAGVSGWLQALFGYRRNCFEREMERTTSSSFCS